MVVAAWLGIALATEPMLDPRDIAPYAAQIQSSDVLGPAAQLALQKSIGSSRIVLLGEGTHGDGTAFQLKTTIVRFLHQEMGFSVLVWESGLYDCSVMDAELGTARDLREVAGLGVFPHWSSAVESFPLFEYARSTRSTNRPLRMAGFDLQDSGTAGHAKHAEFATWFEGLGVLTTSEADAITTALGRFRSADTDQERAEATMTVRETANVYLAAYRREQDRLDQAWGAEAPWRVRSLENEAAYARMLRLNDEGRRSGRGIAEAYNLRERVNAENLEWLTHTAFRGQKIIVWAHNVHIFRGLPGRDAGVWQTPRSGEFESTGRLFARVVGRHPYVLGFFARGGAWSWMGGPPIAIEESAPGSLESGFAGLRWPLGFVDLKGTPTDHPLRRRWPAYLDRQNPYVLTTVWPDGLDGAIYIDRMAPRVPLPPR